MFVVARCARMTTATIAAVAVAAVAAATGAYPAPTAAICKPFSVSGVGKIQWSVIGNLTCREAQPWLLKIIGKHGAADAQANVTNAPKGFHCRSLPCDEQREGHSVRGRLLHRNDQVPEERFPVVRIARYASRIPRHRRR